MACKRRKEDLISINQKLLTEKNLCTKRRYPVEKKKGGWKVFDTKKDDLKNHLISQTVVRENKNTLDFANKAVNPAVYPDVNLNDISDSIMVPQMMRNYQNQMKYWKILIGIVYWMVTKTRNRKHYVQ